MASTMNAFPEKVAAPTRRAKRRSGRNAGVWGAAIALLAAGYSTLPGAAASAGTANELPAIQGQAVDVLVSVGSPSGIHQPNAQEEPSLAVDPTRPNVLVAGSNDFVDLQPCSQEASTTAGACSFPLGTFNLGVGFSAASFSFDKGHTWTQPTYRGLTAADCDATVEPCAAHLGPIHTVPNFYENGLRSRSDTAVTFGPVPVGGKFSWANGSRLYFSTIATNLDDTKIGDSRSGTLAVTVSHIDNVTPDRILDQSNWSRPYFVPLHTASASSLDKEQIWADNAASSPFFGNIYACYLDNHSRGAGDSFPVFPEFAASTDGGVTWTRHPIAPAGANAQQGQYFGCTARTDSHGVVYVFFEHLGSQCCGGSSIKGAHTVVKSFDGGETWTQPVDFVSMTDICFVTDPLNGNHCIGDGVAGARLDFQAMPSVDIANGSPTGADATNEIVDAWSDGGGGQGAEKTLVATSIDGATTWSASQPVSLRGDRSVMSAPAISPDGKTVYVQYEAYQQPFQATTATPRPVHGVLRTTPIGASGVPMGWTTVYNGPSGDARGSSQGRKLYNEFLGDYVYAIATRDYGAGAWTDARRTADCPAIDAWRQSSVDARHLVFPAPWPLRECAANFGNTDIFSATTG